MRNYNFYFFAAIMVIVFSAFIATVAVMANNSNINVPANYICTNTRTNQVYEGESKSYYSKDQTLIIYNTDGSQLVLAGEFACEFTKQEK